MYVCMYVRTYLCMYVCMYVCMNACMHACMYECMHITCFLQVCEFRHIRSFIPKSAAFTFANAFIHSHIDYCNSLLCGLPKFSFHRLQKLQSSVARIVIHTSRSSRVTPLLKSLLWLPVKYRINFKLCCITHCALSLG